MAWDTPRFSDHHPVREQDHLFTFTQGFGAVGSGQWAGDRKEPALSPGSLLTPSSLFPTHPTVM